MGQDGFRSDTSGKEGNDAANTLGEGGKEPSIYQGSGFGDEDLLGQEESRVAKGTENAGDLFAHTGIRKRGPKLRQL